MLRLVELPGYEHFSCILLWVSDSGRELSCFVFQLDSISEFSI